MQHLERDTLALRRMAALVLVAALATGLGATHAAAQAGHPAGEAVRAYQRHAAAHRGDEAARWVTRDTHAFYERCRRAALYMDEPALRRRPPMERFTALSLRITHTAAQLRRMRGRDVLADLIDRELVRGVDRIVIGDIEPRGDTARVEMRSERGRHLGPILVQREADGWRVDLLDVIQRTQAQLGRMASRFGGDDGLDPILLALALAHPDRRPTDDIWTPLAPR